jgi:hypothetical protein
MIMKKILFSIFTLTLWAFSIQGQAQGRAPAVSAPVEVEEEIAPLKKHSGRSPAVLICSTKEVDLFKLNENNERVAKSSEEVQKERCRNAQACTGTVDDEFLAEAQLREIDACKLVSNNSVTPKTPTLISAGDKNDEARKAKPEEKDFKEPSSPTSASGVTK